MIYAAHGYTVTLLDGTTLEGHETAAEAEARERMLAECEAEARSYKKGLARAILDNTRDVGCDQVAAALGLSAHTVRGMSRGGKAKRDALGSSKYVDFSDFDQDSLLQQANLVEW